MTLKQIIDAFINDFYSKPLLLHMRLIFISCFLFLIALTELSATHNRAGEISFEQVGPLSLIVTITTYTKASSQAADRDSLEVDWGDGFIENIGRTNGTGQILANDIKKNIYQGSHTYPALGTFSISMMDPNRIEGIINVNAPNSVIVPFYISTTFSFTNSQFQGYNSSPRLLQPPIDVGCVGQIFKHNPNAFDPDGDSLAYELIVPFQAEGDTVPRYRFPNEISPFANQISLDPVTGDFIWNAPRRAGDYNIAILVKEYRNGQLINSIIRDMQILIEDCDNLPPILNAPDEICIFAGEELRLEIYGTAPFSETDQKVRITALGGPLQLEKDSAFFLVPSGFNNDTLRGLFIWQTNCNHISRYAYTVVFKVEDDFFSGSAGLTDLKTLRIRVMGPPPIDPQLLLENAKVNVSWEAPYACEDAEMEYFRGFSVWRREGSNPFPLDTCIAGLEGKGYTRITFAHMDKNVSGRYQFIDEDPLERGKTYCYRVLAEFAQRTPGGLPYNLVESVTSKEVCIQLGRDLPLLTQVSVSETDPDSGEIIVKWVKPVAEDLDTITNSGPYRYVLKRRDNTQVDYLAIQNADFSFDSFGEFHLDSFVDQNLNTTDLQYFYELDFYVNNELEPLGSSTAASSIYLNLSPTDEKIILTWDETVPWTNFRYDIFMLDQNTMSYDSIGSTTESIFEVDGLVNGESYCFFIRSLGSYNLMDLPDTLVNLSQINCDVPVDNIAPCAPNLSIRNYCFDDNYTESLFSNFLGWSDSVLLCENSEDIDGFDIYFSQDNSSDYTVLESLDRTEFDYLHERLDLRLTGCYYIIAIDSMGNRSIASDTVCTENCPEYVLPNTFTPNNDMVNDIFKPTRSLFIEEVDFKVYNRWGNLVFETSDVSIDWNGEHFNGQDLAAGTYYYTCSLFELTLDGLVERPEKLTGSIDLIK